MKSLIYILAFMFYEISCRVLFIYNKTNVKIKTRNHLRGVNKQSSCTMAAIVVGFNFLIYTHFTFHFLQIHILFQQSLLIFFLTTLFVANKFVNQKSYFNEEFIMKKQQNTFKSRMKNYFVVTIIFFIVPALACLSFL